MISGRGFALAIAILIVVWVFLPDNVKPWLALLLILSVLARDKIGVEVINKFFGMLK